MLSESLGMTSIYWFPNKNGQKLFSFVRCINDKLIYDEAKYFFIFFPSFAAIKSEKNNEFPFQLIQQNRA